MAYTALNLKEKFDKFSDYVMETMSDPDLETRWASYQ